MDKYIDVEQKTIIHARHNKQKFQNPDFTQNGEKRAKVKLKKLETLWINTGTLCNIECINCYIESSPKNDRLVYFSLEDTIQFLDEIQKLNMETNEIGFTGGEPFMNPYFIPIVEETLKRGFQVLILTNAMTPMQRPKIKQGLLKLNQIYQKKLTIRVSLDHYQKELHEIERGIKSWENTINGINWLMQNNFQINICGRTCWSENEKQMRDGFAKLFKEKNWNINPQNKIQLVLLPEMDEMADVPEITEKCWDIIGINPEEMMCAKSRMIVKRKGQKKPTILPCTLLPYDTNFEMGNSLAQSLTANGKMFDNGAVKLNHPHCSKFCVLGGGSCSVNDN